ncbi:glycoside hydrolase family protein [Planctomycetales bacterium]|nr:glycoside hydrolase family protein [Planctomycetales bacterium]
MLSLILHAHLPFVRHRENDFLAGNWLFEAVAECYIPLLQMLDALAARPPAAHRPPAPITFTLTPTLCAMLGDELLQKRLADRFTQILALAEKEVVRNAAEPRMQALAEFYRTRWQNAAAYFAASERDLLARFRRHYQDGRLEIMTCAATHAVLPLLLDRRAVLRQLRVGVNSFREIFDRAPRGCWLPECAYSPEVGAALREAGITYTVLAAHAFLYGAPRPRRGVYAPGRTPDGLWVFGRDPESSKQVWSARDGYPGAAAYREFYRDLGWDGDADYLREFYGAERHDLGFKYHRVTGEVGLDRKELYDPTAAAAQAVRHARHFLAARQQQTARLTERLGAEPLIVAPYDAELFGHWWYEGPQFLTEILTRAADYGVAPTNPAAVIDAGEIMPSAFAPAVSSWGDGGYFFTWLNGENDWLYPPLRAAQKLLNDLEDDGTANRALLRQMQRELLLAQASDWTFILTTRTLPDYARRRLTEHLQNFQRLAEHLNAAPAETAWQQELTKQNNLFADSVLG